MGNTFIMTNTYSIKVIHTNTLFTLRVTYFNFLYYTLTMNNIIFIKANKINKIVWNL